MKIIQEDNTSVGELEVREGAKTRLLIVDEDRGEIVVYNTENLFNFAEIIPINSKKYTENRDALSRELDIDLSYLFDMVGWDNVKRHEFIGNLTERLLRSINIQSDRPILSEARNNSPNDNRMLPEIAPATWKADSEPGDTPASFIKRIYRDYLRDDGTGLSRPDIKKLDPPLYVALANWLRRNDLPADCPLPTKSESLDRNAPRDAGSMTAREWFRQQARARRASQREH